MIPPDDIPDYKSYTDDDDDDNDDIGQDDNFQNPLPSVLKDRNNVSDDDDSDDDTLQ